MTTKLSVSEILVLAPYSEFLASRRSPLTVTSYGNRLAMLHAWLASRGVSCLAAGPRDLSQFIGTIASFYSRATVLHFCHAISSFYGYLLATEQVARDPSAIFRTFRLGKPNLAPRPISSAHAQKLVSGLQYEGIKEARASCVVLLGLYEGMRREEIRTLKWSQVDFRLTGPDGYLTVHGKGDKERMIVLHPKPRTALYRLHCLARYNFGLFPSTYVFRPPRSRQDKAPSPMDITENFYRAKAWSGLQNEGFTLHCLRHTTATWMAESGATAYEIRDFMGHSSISVSEAYVKTQVKQSHSAYRRCFGLVTAPQPVLLPALEK